MQRRFTKRLKGFGQMPCNMLNADDRLNAEILELRRIWSRILYGSFMFILWLFHFAFDKVLLKNFTTTTTMIIFCITQDFIDIDWDSLFRVKSVVQESQF